MVKRGEALHDGLPRDNVVQDDQIMCGVGQMSLDPLGRERVLKCLCYHGMDLCLGCRETPFRHYPTDQRSQKHALGEKISGYYVAKAVDRRYQALRGHSGLEVADVGITMLKAYHHLQDAIKCFQRLFYTPDAEHTGHPLNGNRHRLLLGHIRLSSCT